jgi:hypothetical protein
MPISSSRSRCTRHRSRHNCRLVRARTARDSHMRADFRGRRASYLSGAVSSGCPRDNEGMPYGDHQSG